MHTHSRRAHAWLLKTLAALLAGACFSATADETDPAALELPEAAELAVTGQPLLEAQRNAVRGARAAAVAAGELPDPVLVGGLTDLTITGPDRYTLTRDSDTQFMLGVKQSFPGGGERALRGRRGEAEADRLAAELDEQQRMVRREASLSWLDVWRATQAQDVVRASIAEAERQVQAVEIAYRAGRAAQAELLAARVSAELLADQLASLQQQEWHARNQLRRWIGQDAERLICPDLPAWRAPDADRLIRGLETHPHVTAQARAVTVARTEHDLARADYWPDWSIQAGYGYRPAFADMAMLQFEVGLPLFTRNRQGRVAESRAADVERTEQLKEDWLRQHRAEIRLNVNDWERLQQRFARYDDVILPQSQQRLDAAMAGYGAGRGTLTMVLDARRSLLDIRMQRLELEVDAARHQVQLAYFSVAGEQP
jgi:cobalt-zinc-cadmium efflux system outer membrane protein